MVSAAILNTHVRDNLRFIKGLDGTSIFDVGANFTGTAHMVLVNRVTSANLPATATGAVVYNVTSANFMFAEVQAGGVKWLNRRDITVMTATSMSTGDMFYASGPTSIARLAAGGSGSMLQANGAAAPSWVAAPGALALLQSTSGTSSILGVPSTAVSISITGLGAEDKLLVYVSSNVTMDTAGDTMSTSFINFGTTHNQLVMPTQTNTREYNSYIILHRGSNNTAIVSQARFDTSVGSASVSWTELVNTTGTLNAAWTGTWTLALAQGTTTTAGLNRWRWNVYQLKSV